MTLPDQRAASFTAADAEHALDIACHVLNVDSRGARLHDARHTAATVLLLLGVPDRTVMGLMGWSNSSMTGRYQHMTSAVQRDVADRLNGYLWTPN